jgi:hypothetical protein
LASAEAKVTSRVLGLGHARGYVLLGHSYIFAKRATQGIAEREHALALRRKNLDRSGHYGSGA